MVVTLRRTCVATLLSLCLYGSLASAQTPGPDLKKDSTATDLLPEKANCKGGDLCQEVTQTAGVQQDLETVLEPSSEPLKSSPPNPKKAYQLFTSAKKKYDRLDYSGALTDFLVSNRAQEQPKTTYWLAKTYEKLGQYDLALASYLSVVDKLPKSMSPEVADAKTQIELIRNMRSWVHVESTPEGSSVYIDGGLQKSVTPLDVELAAGNHEFQFTLKSYESNTSAIQLGHGERHTLRVSLKEAPVLPQLPVALSPINEGKKVVPDAITAQKPSALTPKKTNFFPAILTGGFGVVSLGMGAVFGILALSKKADFDKSHLASDADKGENFTLAADMAFGVGLTLGVTSAILFLTSDEEPSENKEKASNISKSSFFQKAKVGTSSVVAAPWIAPSGVGANASLKF